MRILNLLDRGPLDYMEADALQRYIHAEVAACRMPDTLFAWESQETYTAGRRTQPEDIPSNSVPVIKMDRGGSVTYHGPGQLVVYPIVKVKPPKDVVAFVRHTERAIISAMREFSLELSQVEGRSGVWQLANYSPAGELAEFQADEASTQTSMAAYDQQIAPVDRKLCAIGIKFAEDATMHGMALNVTTNVENFMQVVPCGIHDAGVVTLQQLGVDASLTDVLNILAPHLAKAYEQFLLPDRVGSLAATEAAPIVAEAHKARNGMVLPQNTGIAWIQPKAPTEEEK